MAQYVTCDNSDLGLEALFKLLIEGDGAGGAQLKTGASAGVSGGLNVYHNINDADFSVTINDGTNTVDVNGAPFTLEEGNIVAGVAYVIDGDGNRIVIPVNTEIGIAGDTITFGGYNDTFTAATDQVILLLISATKAYDTDLNALLTSILNSLQAHRSNQHLIDEADLTTAGGRDGDGGGAASGANYYYLIPWDTFMSGTMVFLSTTGVGNTFTIDLYGTNNKDAELTDIDLDSDAWIDLSAFLADVAQKTVAAGQTNQRDLWIVNEDLIMEYLLVQVTVVDGGAADNALDMWVKKAR